MLLCKVLGHHWSRIWGTSAPGFGVLLSQDLGCCRPNWGSEFPLGLLSTAPSLSPCWCGSGRGIPGAFQAAPTRAVAPSPSSSRDKSLSMMFLSLLSLSCCPCNPGRSEPAAPLALPSLPRKMETGDKGTFLRCIQACLLPDEPQEVSERADPQCSQGKAATARAGAQHSSGSAWEGGAQSWDRVTPRG